MNRSFILGALVFGTGVLVGMAINNEKKNTNTTEDEGTLHGLR